MIPPEIGIVTHLLVLEPGIEFLLALIGDEAMILFELQDEFGVGDAHGGEDGEEALLTVKVVILGHVDKIPSRFVVELEGALAQAFLARRLEVDQVDGVGRCHGCSILEEAVATWSCGARGCSFRRRLDRSNAHDDL